MSVAKTEMSLSLSVNGEDDDDNEIEIVSPYVSVFLDKEGQFTQEGHKILENEPDKKKKLEELEKWIDRSNSPAAMYDLASCYRNQYLGLKGNPQRAFNLVYQAALLNYPLALFSIAEYCRKQNVPKADGKDEKKDMSDIYENLKPEDEFNWLEKAANKGLTIAQCYLALWYKNHPEMELNMVFAESLLKSAEQKGNATARAMLKKFFPAEAETVAYPAKIKSEDKQDAETMAYPAKEKKDDKAEALRPSLLPILKKAFQDKEQQIAKLEEQETLVQKENILLLQKWHAFLELKKGQELLLAELEKRESELKAKIPALPEELKADKEDSSKDVSSKDASFALPIDSEREALERAKKAQSNAEEGLIERQKTIHVQTNTILKEFERRSANQKRLKELRTALASLELGNGAGSHKV